MSLDAGLETLKKQFYITRIKFLKEGLLIVGETNRMSFELNLSREHRMLNFQSGYVEKAKVIHRNKQYIFANGVWAITPTPDIINLVSKLSKLVKIREE